MGRGRKRVKKVKTTPPEQVEVKKVKTTPPEQVEEKVETTRPEEDEVVEVQVEDRISRLPDDLLHHILSFVAVNDSIQTGQLSTRWKHVWRSLHVINLDRFYYRRCIDYCKFVTKFLSHRDPHSDISVFNLKRGCGGVQHSLIKKVAVYAASHKVQTLHLSAFVSSRRYYKNCGGVTQVRLSDFSCRSLKQLCLSLYEIRVNNQPKWTWSLPSLTTLFLGHVSFGFCCDSHSSKSADPFSRLFNLKNLTVYDCGMDGLETFNVISPQLETLVFTCVDRQYLCEFVVSAPKLVSFEYTGGYGLIMSKNDLRCLDQLYINISGPADHITLILDNEKRRTRSREVINMFRQLGGARSVSLTLYTIEVISWLLDSLKKERSPFRNIERLKIEGHQYRFANSTKLPTGVITFLCNSSPNSTVSIASKECFKIS